MNTGVALLTERERECLRLLLRPLRAKSIARELGLSHHTVNDHLRSARGKLGAADSLSAAHMLREVEGELPPKAVGTKESGYPAEPSLAQNEPSKGADAVRKIVWPLAARGRPWNASGTGWRLLWPIIIAFAAVLAAGVFAGGLAAVSTFVLELTHGAPRGEIRAR